MLLRREGSGVVEVFAGVIESVDKLADLPLNDTVGAQLLALVPYRQVRERGFEHVDDGAPLRYLRITERDEVAADEVLRSLPTDPVRLTDGGFDVGDAAYARTVEAVLREEIGRGAGSNFVVHRTYRAAAEGRPLATAFAAFARLLRDERGAYWTFLVHTGDRTLVGASPERHVSVDDGLVMMNPISGTYRHPAGGADRDGLLRFLAERKEIDELYMVLDEELKMMATVADRGGQVIGPYLKEMAHLTHTEYLLVGRGSLDVRDVLRQTMFAPTVVGSPIENACRVVARNERRGRGYYGGVLALLGRDAGGAATLDAPILIRTVEISADGTVRVPVGATLVRHSTPDGEVAETYAKAAGILSALGLRPAVAPPERQPVTFATDPQVRAALARRNDPLARFWLDERSASPVAPAFGRRVLVVDAEDTFTGMLAHQLRALGLEVTLRSYRESVDSDGYDLVVAGPGPGDPAALEDPKMATLRGVIGDLLARRRPVLGICLGHQLLVGLLGLPLYRKDVPYQGVQRQIDFFGRPARVGFYSTFAARHPGDQFVTPYGSAMLSRDAGSGEVHAVRGERFAGVQFHPESVLSEHGVDLLRDLVRGLVDAAPRPA